MHRVPGHDDHNLEEVVETGSEPPSLIATLWSSLLRSLAGKGNRRSKTSR